MYAATQPRLKVFARIATISPVLPAIAAVLAATLVVVPLADAAEGEGEEISYFADIRPILQKHCHGCHQPAKRGGDYVMTSYDQLVAAGESGEKAIVPGKPEESLLLTQITPEDGKAQMPKEGKPLHATEIAKIRQWISDGAPDDTPMSARPKYDMEHPPIYEAAPVITSLDYSPDGSLLAISAYHEVVLHKTDGSGIAGRLVGVSERIQSLSFSPDGAMLAVSGGNPGRMGELQIWKVAGPELVRSVIVGFDTLYGVSWSPDGKLVGFGCSDNTARAVDVASGKEVFFNGAHSDWVLDTVFSVKSDHLVTVSRDRSAKLINVPTQRFIDNITSITPGALKGGLHAVDRHPTEEQIVTGGADGNPKLYRMYREQARKIGDDFNLIRAFPKMSGRVFDVAFSKAGDRVIAGSSYNGQGEVQVYNVADAKSILKIEIPESGIFATAFHPDGNRVAVGGFDGLVRIIDIKQGKVVAKTPPVPLQEVAGR